MQIFKLILSILALPIGVFIFFYGGYDDSPGGQLLGLIIFIMGIVGIVRLMRKNMRRDA